MIKWRGKTACDNILLCILEVIIKRILLSHIYYYLTVYRIIWIFILTLIKLKLIITCFYIYTCSNFQDFCIGKSFTSIELTDRVIRQAFILCVIEYRSMIKLALGEDGRHPPRGGMLGVGMEYIEREEGEGEKEIPGFRCSQC